MTPQEFLLVVFCLIDDQLKALDLGRLRRRGFAPKLSDAEVITIEVVGEFWGLDADRDIFRHFQAYHTAEFPALADLSRTTFARQAANLWRVKHLIQSRLARWLTGDDPRWLVDTLPIDACQFARATFCRRFQGAADYGYDHLRKRTYYGFRLHLRTSREGAIESFLVTSARPADATVTPALDPPPGSTGIGDRGYYNPAMRRVLAAGGVTLHAPYYQRSRDPDPKRSARLASIRYRIETVGSQLTVRYHIKQTRARDVWHLVHRIIRKILSHTVMICLDIQETNPPLSFDWLRPAA
jgi:Transposase DDE domain